MPRNRSQSAPKRKHDDDDAFADSQPEEVPKKPKTAAEAGKGQKTEEDLEWKRQYYQGVHDLSGIGCGHCLHQSPLLTFQAPFEAKGRIEVDSGDSRSSTTVEDGNGSIRMEEEGRSITEQPENPVVCLFPFVHAEQIIALAHGNRHRVLIVPTAATGASSIKRKYPQIVSFDWQYRKGKDDFYLAGLKEVLDKQLAPFEKAVIDVTGEPDTEHAFRTTATLEEESEATSLKPKTKADVWFLDAGIAVSSPKTGTNMFITFESLDDIMLIAIKDLSTPSKTEGGRPGKEPVALNMLCRVGEPFYNNNKKQPADTAKKPVASRPILLNFKGIPPERHDRIKKYCKTHELKVMDLQQTFYNYANNQPATGFMPRVG
ncbi:hypothetical protein F4780DRAFT_419032 [Xylariomycetidae sp. FL0641]|nr:hypothetical protein F4780DRAFT_419032 [Xylariomycetidae sp. FL0641]